MRWCVLYSVLDTSRLVCKDAVLMTNKSTWSVHVAVSPPNGWNNRASVDLVQLEQPDERRPCPAGTAGRASTLSSWFLSPFFAVAGSNGWNSYHERQSGPGSLSVLRPPFGATCPLTAVTRRGQRLNLTVVSMGQYGVRELDLAGSAPLVDTYFMTYFYAPVSPLCLKG